MLVVLNQCEWERKWPLISISFSIDPSLLLAFPLTLARVVQKALPN